MMKFLTTMTITATTIFMCVAGLLCADAKISYDLGYIEIDLRSTQPAQTNNLLHSVLSVTTDYVSVAFNNETDGHYERIAVSVRSYNVGGSAEKKTDEIDMAPYTAFVTITGVALFNDSTKWTQTNVTDLMSSIFAMDNTERSFLDELKKDQYANPFLTNLTYVAVRVDGNVVAEEINNEPKLNTDSDAPTLEVWMIALIGGLGAFVVVLCVVIACICCIPLDDDAANKVKMQKNQLGQHGTNPTRSDSKMEENLRTDYIDNSPSEAKSIGSQDSSLFTYNPKSVRSFDSRKSYNSYFTYGTQGVEMDVAAWQANTASNIVPDEYAKCNGTSISANQISFNQDISAIEAKKGDLSLIQEDEENESTIAGSVSVASSADVVSPLPIFISSSPTHENTSNTVASSSPSRASGKYKSLLAGLSHSKSISTTGVSNTTGGVAQQYLMNVGKHDVMDDDEENDNVMEIYSRDSQSTGTVSTSQSNGSKKKIQYTNVEQQSRQQPLSTALASGPPFTVVQKQSTNPVAIYGTNNQSTVRSSTNNSRNANYDDTIMCRPSDEETDDTESSYGPSYYEAKPRINLSGTAHDVLNDLHDLSAQIDEVRNSHSSGNSTISGRAAIRLRR